MAGGGGAPPALIRGVLLDLSLLLRVSHGGLPAFRPSAGAAAAANAAGHQRKALSSEEQLERRIRMEIVGGGGAAAARAASTSTESQQPHSPNDEGTSLVGGLAQALGVRGFDGQQGRPLLDPRDPLRSAMASAAGASTPPPPPRSSPGPASTPPPPPRGASGSAGNVRAKYMEKLKARTAAGKAAGGAGDAVLDDEAARRTRARRLVEATELRGGGGAGHPSAASAAAMGPGGALLSNPVLELLGYLNWRGLRLGLLPRGRTITPAELVGARPPHAIGFDALLPLALDGEAAERKSTPTLNSRDDEEGEDERERERRRRLEEGLKWLSTQVRVEPRRLLVVTGEAPLAAAGRAGGFFTCLVQKRGQEAEDGASSSQGGNGGVDYQIGAWEELRDVVEDLNGVSLRPWPPR